MEGVAYCDQAEFAVQRHFFGRPCRPSDVADPEAPCLLRAELDEFRLLVDGHDLADLGRQREGDLARSTGEIEYPGLAVEWDTRSQIVEQRGRVRHTEPVVVLGCAFEEILSVAELAGHRVIESHCRAARAGPRSIVTPWCRNPTLG